MKNSFETNAKCLHNFSLKTSKKETFEIPRHRRENNIKMDQEARGCACVVSIPGTFGLTRTRYLPKT
jgi:hypothetical protein